MKQLDIEEYIVQANGEVPKVTLIDYTGNGTKDPVWHAAHILVFTKSTRLAMNAGVMKDIQAMARADLQAELDAMAATIPSSWEFVDVTFLIENVSRATAQQITRTRNASYAMQSQRVVDVGEAHVHNPLRGSFLGEGFDTAAQKAVGNYRALQELGAAKEDARGLLPINICCNLVAKYNLRAFVELMTSRASLRTQGEYAMIVAQMKEEVLEAWPWATTFFEPRNSKVIKMLEEVVGEIGMTTGNGAGWKVAKAMDLLRKG